MAHQARTETTGLDPLPVTAVTDDSDCLSMFPPETPDGLTRRVSRTPSHVRVPADTNDSVDARGDLAQLDSVAARLEGQYESLAKGLSESDSRSAAAVDTLRTVERQVAALAAELDTIGSAGVRDELEHLAARLDGQYERLAKGLSESDTRSAAALDTLQSVERRVAALAAELDTNRSAGVRDELEQLAARLDGQYERLAQGLSESETRSVAAGDTLRTVERQVAALAADLDINGSGVRDELDQLAARLDGQYERLAKGLSEAETRSVAAVDTLRTVERQVAAIAGEHNNGDAVVRGELEQLRTLAARLEGQYERLAQGLSESDTRSAAALDSLRNVERQAAELTAALNRLGAQARALLDAKLVAFQTDRALETETTQGTHVAARNTASTKERLQSGVTQIANLCMQWVTGTADRCMQWWVSGIANRRLQRWMTEIAHRRIPAMGLVALVLVSLAIAPALMRLNQIREAPVAASPAVAGNATNSRTTDLSLPLEVDLKTSDPSDAPKVPDRAVPSRSSTPSPVKQTGTIASAGSVKVSNQTTRSRSSTPSSVDQPRAAAYVGNLAVNSTPAGATVLLEGRPAGVTPLQLTALPARNYIVWLELKGYERWTNSVLVPADKLTRVAVTLQPVRTAPSPIK